jgi:RNA polymerase sigma-70 factor, ECF subfamily
LLRRALQGDDEAFGSLALRHCDQVYAIARNLSASQADAFDLMRSAFQLAWNRLHDLPGDMSFRVFVCRFLTRDALDRLRQPMATASSSRDRLLRSLESGALGSQPEWGWLEIDELARRGDIVERLGDGLAALDPDDRAAFVLQIVEGIPAEDVAAILEVPIGTVRRRTRLACLLMSAYLSRLSAPIGDREERQPARWIH